MSRATKQRPGKARRYFRHRAASAAQQAQQFRRDDFTGNSYQGRNLGMRAGDRELTDPERMRALRFARANYKRNGLYGQLVHRLLEHTYGDGVVLGEFGDDTVKDYVESVLTETWFEQLEDRWRETINEGEYMLVIRTDRRNFGPGAPVPTGLVRFGRFDVEQIRGVHVNPEDPDNIVEINIRHDDDTEAWYPILGSSSRLPKSLAAISYWSINKMGSRGSPQFVRILEKAQLVDDVVDQQARKGEYLGRHWLKGEYVAQDDADKDAEFEDDAFAWMTNAEPGEAFIASKAREFKVEVLAPDLKTPEQRALYDMVLDFVCGSAGVPKHWFGGGGDTNRATAVEQGSPAHRMLIKLQKSLKRCVSQVIDHLIWMGKASGRILHDADEAYQVHMSQIPTRDAQRDVSTVQQLASALTHARTEGLISIEEAQRIYRGALVAQTTFDVALDDKPPDPETVGPDARIADVRDQFGRGLRESLPGHRRILQTGGP